MRNECERYCGEGDKLNHGQNDAKRSLFLVENPFDKKKELKCWLSYTAGSIEIKILYNFAELYPSVR